MWNKVIAAVLALAVPAAASAGPLKDAVEKAGRDFATAQSGEAPGRGRGRLWMNIALIGGGGALATLGALEVGESETGSDTDDADDAETGKDSDAWSKVMLGGGIAAAALGTVFLIKGRKKSGPVLSVGPKRVAVRHTVRF